MSDVNASPSLQARHFPLADRFFRVLVLGCGLLVLAVLVLITISMTSQALPAFRQEGLRFLTSRNWDPNTDHYGALAFIYGTLVSSAIALVMAVPVSIGIALFLSELAPRRLRRPVSYVIDLLASVPSVVFGLWGVLVLGPFIEGPYQGISDGLGGLPLVGPLFGGPVNDRSLFTGGLILAFMITPIITAITREVFDTVPRGQKEAAYALGATRWEMVRGAILPHGRTGVVGAVMLGLGRAMGETIALALVLGSVPRISAQLFGPADAMPATIANQFGEASGLHRSALIGLGVTLFAVTVVVNLMARLVVHRAVVREASS